MLCACHVLDLVFSSPGPLSTSLRVTGVLELADNMGCSVEKARAGLYLMSKRKAMNSMTVFTEKQEIFPSH
jgi:hypothetical protein